MAAYLGLSLTVVDKVGVLPSATETACSGGGRRLNEGRTVCDMPREVGLGAAKRWTQASAGAHPRQARAWLTGFQSFLLSHACNTEQRGRRGKFSD